MADILVENVCVWDIILNLMDKLLLICLALAINLGSPVWHLNVDSENPGSDITRQSIISVSYTHLTLPTKRIV